MRLKQIHLSGVVLGIAWILIFSGFARGGVAQKDRAEKEKPVSFAQTLETNKEVVRRVYADVLNTGDFDRLERFVSADYAGGSAERGPAAFAEPIRELRRAFPDIQWTLEDLVAEGDRVTARWTWRGTHSQPFRNFPPSHKQVTSHGMAIFQLANDGIVRSWIETDRLGFFQQIGVVPQDLVTAPQPQAAGNRP